LAVAHPDRNDGDGELFVFLTALREHVESCSVAVYQRPPVEHHHVGREDQDRVPYDAALGAEDEFWTLTHRALSIAQRVEEPFRSLLLLLMDFCPTDHGRRADKQARGATYKQLAYIAHLVPCDKEERIRWYEICRTIPLAEAHATYVVNELKRRAKAKGRAA
jgi:hypothetical protein